MTRFDLRAPKRGDSASLFVYGWADQRGPVCLFVSFMYTGESLAFITVVQKMWFFWSPFAKYWSKELKTPDFDYVAPHWRPTCMFLYPSSTIGIVGKYFRYNSLNDRVPIEVLDQAEPRTVVRAQ